jgi:hypothetical protein
MGKIGCPECQKEITTKFNGYGSVHRKYIPIYIQKDATLHSLLYLETDLHVLGGTSTHHQEYMQLYLRHLVLITPLLLPAAIAAGSSNGLIITTSCIIHYLNPNSWTVFKIHIKNTITPLKH